MFIKVLRFQRKTLFWFCWYLFFFYTFFQTQIFRLFVVLLRSNFQNILQITVSQHQMKIIKIYTPGTELFPFLKNNIGIPVNAKALKPLIAYVTMSQVLKKKYFERFPLVFFNNSPLLKFQKKCLKFVLQKMLIFVFLSRSSLVLNFLWSHTEQNMCNIFFLYRYCIIWV